MTPIPLAPEQCSMARNGLRLSVEEVSAESGVSRDFIKRLEMGDRVGPDIVARLMAWYEDRGVVFTPGGVILPLGVWRLRPLDLDHRDWAASTQTVPIVVRALGARRARQIASLACGIATRRVPSEPLAVNPWGQESRVAAEELAAEELKEKGWSAEGPEAILEPEDLDTEWR